MDGLLLDGELVTQGEVFQAERCPGAEQRSNKGQQGRDDRDDAKPPRARQQEQVPTDPEEAMRGKSQVL
jgi:hypothetical protein